MQKANLAKNTTYYTVALTVQKILAFIYFWLISNSLLPGNLGQYVFALSFSTLFSIFIDLGLSSILTREAAKSKEQANSYLILGKTGSFQLLPGKIHSDLVKVQPSPSSPLCEIKYSLSVVKDGQPYDSPFFIVKIV